MGATRELEAYLRGKTDLIPDPALLREVGIAGHAYARAAATSKPDMLHGDYVHATARHLAVRTALAELLWAFAARGVDVLAFKGFHLAEFVFDSPGRRPYADVDLAVRPERVDDACRTARERGWTVVWRLGTDEGITSPRPPDYVGHEAAALRHPDLELTVDLHRRLVHNNHNRIRPGRTPERLTRAAWAQAQEVHLEGAPLLVPAPVDALLFGLVLNRCWGSDAWHVKPRDYLDFEVLVDRFGLTRAMVDARASELSVLRTWRIYARRCDTWRGRLRLARPSWLERRLWNLTVTPERGAHDLVRLPVTISDGVAEVAHVARAVPTVLIARRQARHGIPAPRPRPPRRGPSSFTARDWKRLRRGVHRALRILGSGAGDRDHVLHLALAHALRDRGLDARIDEAGGAERGKRRLLVDGRPVPVHRGAGDVSDAPEGHDEPPVVVRPSG